MSLLNVAQTAPYFHSGTVTSLEDVVRQYNAGGGPPGTYVGTVSPKIRPLLLTETEIAELVEFLGTLTGVSPADQAAADPTIWNWAANTAKPALPRPPRPLESGREPPARSRSLASCSSACPSFVVLPRSSRRRRSARP